jgi:hypothetical protein
MMMFRSLTRRESLALGIASLAGAGAVSAAETGKRPLSTDFLFEMHADLEPPQELGATPNGRRRIYNVRGGQFAGPRLRGKILPGGGDWLLERSDDTSVLDVRVSFQTDDDALIYVNYRGLVHLPPAARDKWEAGQPLQWSEYYFRTAPFFETSAEEYLWLNKVMAIGVGEFTATSVDYTVYEIK